VLARDVEAVEYFLLPLPASYKISRFRVCFHFHLLSSKCFCFRFYKNLNATTASASNFYIPSPCFMKNASASSKSQMLPSLLPFSASFFKLLPQKFNRFHIPGAGITTF